LHGAGAIEDNLGRLSYEGDGLADQSTPGCSIARRSRFCRERNAGCAEDRKNKPKDW
jgi:hypothetical protein